ncbi:thiamine pyrophosphate-binding protein [Rhodococcus sp. JT-3]|uniref:thiamine pyrophosphate-binding protein n=1 Tax=Rhodococcus sp. JT-3 TaxID=1973213 RepID=UPI0018EF030C|nr:thiamine pyrophosphate-binding protein [Rhodococcus sp. JT-3]
MKTYTAIAQALREHKVDVMFGLMGDANLFMADSFEADFGGQFVAACHESSAVLMAHGYAGVSQRIGVATITHGPGLTNTVTALVEGVRSRTPVLVIAGDTATEDKNNLQNICQRDIVMSSGAGFEQARSAHTVLEDLAVALKRAVNERRPIVFNIPKEFQWADIEFTSIESAAALAPAAEPDDAQMDAAVGIIAASSRPVILAGRGAAAPDARKAVQALAERIGAPVCTTLRGKGIFREDPYDLGICGGLASEVGLDAIVGADCIIAFGAGLNILTTDVGELFDGKRVVQCDFDATAIGRYHRVDAGVVGDAGKVAETIIEWLDQAEIQPTGYRSSGLKERLAAAGYAGSTRARKEGTVDIQDALITLEKSLDSQRILVADVGRFMTETVKMLSVPDPFSYVHGGNFASIGLGMGNAIGASFACPNRPTLLVTGDGGFMLGGLTEFNTAVRYGRDLIVAVMNDNSYGAEHIQFRTRDMDPRRTLFEWPDFSEVATALGGSGFTVTTKSDLDALPEKIQNRRGPLLLDIRLDPDAMPEPARY